jgi:tetratricopeptide (TPR) repeat protein
VLNDIEVAPPRRLVWVVGLFLSLHMLALWLPLPALWSLGFLAYGPRWVAPVFALISAAILVPCTRRALVGVWARLPPLSSPWHSVKARVFWASVATALFVLLRSEVHLLGDGYLMLRELAMLATRSGNEPLALWWIEQLFRLGAVFSLDAETVFRCYSYSAGFVYVLLAFSLADELAESAAQRRLLASALLTAGYIQLFCGYIETYPLFFTGILGYVLVGVRALQRGRSPGGAALYLALLTTYHYIAFMLSPSLLVLVWSARRRELGWGRIAMSFLLASAVALAVLYALGVNPFAYTEGLRSSHFLPLSGPLDYTQAYLLFSLQHVLDVCNEYLLVAPMVALVLLGCRIAWRGDAMQIFLGLAALGPLCFVFCANPEIGAFRDWDILAVPALPLVLWTVRSARAEKIGREGLVLLVGAVGLHLLSWLALNADAPSALARYEMLLQKTPLSQHARSYGWETLGSYYRSAGDRAAAQRAFAMAVDANPDNARHWQALAGEYMELGLRDKALVALRAGLQRDGQNAAMWDLLGTAHAALAAWDSSVVAHGRAVEIDAGNAQLWYNLGNAQLGAGSGAAAVPSFQRALQLDARRGEIHFNLAQALEQIADEEGALAAYMAAAERGYSTGHFNMASLYARREQWDKAKRAAERFLALEGTGVHAQALRQFLRTLPP